jgi:hypothetical protein
VAVEEFVEAALRSDVRRVIELTPPGEIAALHDIGQLLVNTEGQGTTGDTFYAAADWAQGTSATSAPVPTPAVARRPRNPIELVR